MALFPHEQNESKKNISITLPTELVTCFHRPGLLSGLVVFKFLMPGAQKPQDLWLFKFLILGFHMCGHEGNHNSSCMELL